MTLKPFSQDVLEVLVETRKQVCLPISEEDTTVCQYLVEKKLARYCPHSETITLTEKGHKLYENLANILNGKLGF